MADATCDGSVVIGAEWEGDGPPSFAEMERVLRKVVVEAVPGEAWRIEIEPAARRPGDPPNLMRARCRGPADAIVAMVEAFEDGGVCDEWHPAR